MPEGATFTLKPKQGFRSRVTVHGQQPELIDGPNEKEIVLKTGEQQIIIVDTFPYNATQE